MANTGASLTPMLIPWGRLADGKLGLNINDDTGIQLNSVLEVWPGTDPVVDVLGDTFPGRLALLTGTGLVYVYDPTISSWRELGSLPATVGVTDPATGLPPITPTPLTGELFWATDNEVCYVWDGSRWQPIGGRYAGYFKSQYYGNASPGRTTFPLGLTVAEIDSLVGAEQNVEAFVDGARQSYAAGDYLVEGGNVRFVTPMTGGENVYVRTLVSDVIAPTATVESYYFDQFSPVDPVDGARTQFELGSAGVSRPGTQVYVNGIIQTGPADPVTAPVVPDYDILSQDTTIASLTVDPGGLTISVLCNAAHNASPGASVVIEGVSTEPLFNATYEVQSITDPLTFVVDNPNAISDLTPPVVDAGMFYTPPFMNDILEIPSSASGDPPLVAGVDKILVRVVRNLVATETTGEENDGVNIGAGVGVYKDKFGTDLRFRSILAGANISVVDTGNEILINASSGATFEERNGINTGYHLLGGTESYIGVLSTSPPVTIDLSSVTDVIDAGRRVIIKDESGGAASNNITIIHAGKTFDGMPNYIIDSNYGVVELVFSGANWFVTSGDAGGAGPIGVTSFASRTGAVLPLAGDYNAIKITYSNVASGLTSVDVQNALDEIVAGGAAAVPTGVLAPFGGTVGVLPVGWMLCDGKTIGNNLSGAVFTGPQYENLFNVVKTLWPNTGSEDFASNDTVMLPDLRGRVPAGPDNMGGVVAAQLNVSGKVPDPYTPGRFGGDDDHVLTEAEMPSHDHTIGSDPLVNTGSGQNQETGANNWGTVSPAETDPTGGDLAHNNVQPIIILNWIIKL